MTEHEKRFMAYWEKNREKERKTLKQWYIGLPIGLVFAVPIALNYSLGWYRRAEMFAASQFNPLVLVVALMAIVTFMAIFYKRHQWEMNEQRYLELKAREEEEGNYVS